MRSLIHSTIWGPTDTVLDAEEAAMLKSLLSGSLQSNIDSNKKQGDIKLYWIILNCTRWT